MNMKKVFKVMVLAIFTFFIFNVNIHSYINCNGAGSGYDEGSRPLKDMGIPMETLITDGAGHFLAANSHIQLILAAIEGQDTRPIDFDELRLTAENAFNQMRAAKMTYEKLIPAASNTPYNEIVISKLMEFDYRGYEKEHHLNGVIFDEVEGSLKKGDITGIFKKVHSSISGITGMLAEVNTELAQNRLPSVQLCWRLNEAISETALFGSYVARVFASLR